MAFSGDLKFEGFVLEFENLVRHLKLSNRLEEFLDELDKATGRVR